MKNLSMAVFAALSAFGCGGSGFETMTHRYVTPTTTVVTAVPDWVKSESAPGNARPLPRYLHALSFDSVYPEDAQWYYDRQHEYGSCSARYSTGVLERNYDWKFDDMAEFVVEVSGNDDRFASIGVANVGTNLTESFVNSGKWSRYYKALAGHTVDGINENGVCAEVNVVDGDPQTSGWHDDGGIHPLGAVRWALDNGTSAEMAASNLAAKIKFPAGWTQNFHYMIADETSVFLVEDGAFYNIDGSPIITNFKLLPWAGTGTGIERFYAISSSGSITNVWFTRAYSPDTDWVSDFPSASVMSAAKTAWATKPKEEHRGEKSGDYSWWQTVHTSVYDISNRVLRVAVQETDDWYVFSLAKKFVETDPTVPAWAKQPTPPEGMTANALVWTNGTVVTKDGGKTIGASDVGAYSTVESDAKYVPWANDAHDAVTIGSRVSGVEIGNSSLAQGWSVKATGYASHAEGVSTYAEGYSTHAEGFSTHADGISTHAEGYSTHAEGISTHAGNDREDEGISESYGYGSAAYACGWGAEATNQTEFVWQGIPQEKNAYEEPTAAEKYYGHGHGTFNLNPVGGVRGVWIGETNLATHLDTVYSATTNYTDSALDSRLGVIESMLDAALGE